MSAAFGGQEQHTMGAVVTGRPDAVGQRSLPRLDDASTAVPFYVRQLKDLKASMPLAALAGTTLDDYGSMCAAPILALSHARTATRAHLRLLRPKHPLDEAFAGFALPTPTSPNVTTPRSSPRCAPARLVADAGPDPAPEQATLGWPDLAVSIR